MSNYALDANTISYYLRENAGVIEKLSAAIVNGDLVVVAPIAYYEVKRGLVAIGSTKRQAKLEEFCSLFPVGQSDVAVFDKAAEIYKQLKDDKAIIEDADILIAAFCKRYGFTLVTHNVKHFGRVTGLNFVDWITV
ncbi:MAG: PIN domain-containing protein [Coriobacteriales bacterium]|nr:PIN domain-containing protein [Coriobacteriales bacterium]